MAWDKRQSICHRQRIPEITLLSIAMMGGSPGVLLAMLLCRHKTRKPVFLLGVPLILIIQGLAIFNKIALFCIL